MAIRAGGVTGNHQCLLLGVARRATRSQRLGSMWQALVAALALLVAGVGGYLLHALCVAITADGRARQLNAEGVRLVALGAFYAAVRAVVGGGELVTAATAAGGVFGVRAARVGIVAADAAPGFAHLRVVGMHVAVAARAGAFRAGFHVVRRVTAGATVVRSHARAAQRRLILMAGAAVDGLLSAKLVRAVAAEAFAVSTGE